MEVGSRAVRDLIQLSDLSDAVVYTVGRDVLFLRSRTMSLTDEEDDYLDWLDV